MSLLTVDKANVKEDIGIIYLIELDIEEEGKFVKVGVTTKPKPEERWQQILTSCWKAYRVFPRCYPKRFRKTDKIFEKEKTILNYLSEYQTSPKKQVDGHTEMHKIPLDEAVKVYESVLNNEELYISDDECKLCGKKKIFDINGNKSCAFNCEVELGDIDVDDTEI